jgi:hypothetical protein
VTWAADRLAAPGNVVCLHDYRSEHEAEQFYIAAGSIDKDIRHCRNLLVGVVRTRQVDLNSHEFSYQTKIARRPHRNPAALGIDRICPPAHF